jgi:hypothetical protein
LKEKKSYFNLVIFVSATVALFAGQGRSPYLGYLSFAWWMALIALIISLISSLSLMILSFYITPISETMENQM